MGDAQSKERSLPTHNSLLSLRKCTKEDYPFLKTLYWEVMKEWVSASITWNEDDQEEWFRNTFSIQGRMIVQIKGENMGTIKIIEQREDFVLEDIEIASQWQSKGYGEKLIGDLLERAKKKGKKVRLQVLKTNPALRLYTRMEFTLEEETRYHYRLVK